MANNTKFWQKIEASLDKHAELEAGGPVPGGCCLLWVGYKDKNGYGVKRVTWPDGSVSREGAHRMAYMLNHKLLRHDVPRLSLAGLELEVSHLCHKKSCILPSHLVLEDHETNASRHRCYSLGACTLEHAPVCLLPRPRPF